jgi:hypothetical protein
MWKLTVKRENSEKELVFTGEFEVLVKTVDYIEQSDIVNNNIYKIEKVGESNESIRN